jgi:hypothetical protein
VTLGEEIWSTLEKDLSEEKQVEALEKGGSDLSIEEQAHLVATVAKEGLDAWDSICA